MPVLVVVLFGTGLFLSVRLGFVQVRRFGEALKAFFGGRAGGVAGVLTPFQAFMTALGTTIGTGNIAGVAAGIASGGPGVLFWIWCYGFFATAIKFAEAVLGVTFRETSGRDDIRSGPMYYLRDGLKSPAIAMTFAIVAGIAALTTTPFTQTNSIALVMNTQVGVPKWVSGVVVAVLTWLVIIGGIKSIGRAFEKLAPAKILIYLAGSLVVIVTYAGRLPDVLALVFREAFTTDSAFGLGVYAAIRYGLARGLYANEAGYGTAAVAYGTAQSDASVAAGTQRCHGDVHRLVRHVHAHGAGGDVVRRDRLDAAGRPARDEHGRCRHRVRRGDAGIRRVPARIQRLSVRLRHAHRLVVLRGEVPRVLAGTTRGDAVPLGLLPADSARRSDQGGSRLGLGRPDERAADLPEPDRRPGAERHRRQRPPTTGERENRFALSSPSC